MKIEHFDDENIEIIINEHELLYAFDHPDYLDDFISKVFNTIYSYIYKLHNAERKDE